MQLDSLVLIEVDLLAIDKGGCSSIEGLVLLVRCQEVAMSNVRRCHNRLGNRRCLPKHWLHGDEQLINVLVDDICDFKYLFHFGLFTVELVFLVMHDEHVAEPLVSLQLKSASVKEILSQLLHLHFVLGVFDAQFAVWRSDNLERNLDESGLD